VGPTVRGGCSPNPGYPEDMLTAAARNLCTLLVRSKTGIFFKEKARPCHPPARCRSFESRRPADAVAL